MWMLRENRHLKINFKTFFSKILKRKKRKNVSTNTSNIFDEQNHHFFASHLDHIKEQISVISLLFYAHEILYNLSGNSHLHASRSWRARCQQSKQQCESVDVSRFLSALCLVGQWAICRGGVTLQGVRMVTGHPRTLTHWRNNSQPRYRRTTKRQWKGRGYVACHVLNFWGPHPYLRNGWR